MPVTAELLARGRGRYNIYCAPCHDQAEVAGEGVRRSRGGRGRRGGLGGGELRSRDRGEGQRGGSKGLAHT